jgi:hypothetical protein
MALQSQQLVINDFTGGITDYVLDADPTQSYIIENLVINKNKKLESVPGSTIYNENYPQVPDGNVRIGGMFKTIEPQLFVNSGRKVWYPNTSSWTAISGPSSNPVFSSGSATSFMASSEWVDHTYLTNSDYSYPVKIYKSSGGYQVRTAGLPALANSPSLTLPATYFYTFTVTAANATIGATYTNNGITYTVAATIAAGTTLTMTSTTSQVPTGATLTRTSGTGDATITFSSVVSPTNNYVYAFHYFYQYNTLDTQYEDNGPVTYVALSNVNEPSVRNVSVSLIPAITNGTTLNYDTANIKVYIYRTINNGVTFYKIGEVTNGTTTFTDNFADSSIQNNLLLYTNGGVLDYDPPPLCKYIHIVNGVAYYANIQDGAQYYKNQIRQSIQGDPDSCPAGFTIDVLEEIVGLSSYTDNPIVFTKKRVYRLNGQYDELGQGQVTFEDITKTVGCMSHNSIVQTRFGVFWAGDDGFYWTDGFNYKKISDSINERYKTLVSDTTRQARIYATYDTVENKIHWACSADDAATDNDTFFTLDLRWGYRDTSTFTTRVNGDSFAPTAIIFYNGNLIRADRRGYVFKHSSDYTTDPHVNELAAYSTWTEKTIIPNYVSTVFNFGLPMIRKWVTKMLLSMQNVTDVSVQINSVNDQSTTTNELFPIRVRENVLWGSSTIIWGVSSLLWSSSKLIEQIRRFPASSLRCSYKQIQITQAYTIVYNSDTFGVANVNSSTKVAALTGSLLWPTDSVDYYISFDSDGYTKQYLVTALSGSSLTYQDPTTLQPTASNAKWLIKGYPKGEVFNIVSYVIYYAPLTDQSFRTYRTEQDSTGANT